jgi:hypothetical protein
MEVRSQWDLEYNMKSNYMKKNKNLIIAICITIIFSVIGIGFYTLIGRNNENDSAQFIQNEFNTTLANVQEQTTPDRSENFVDSINRNSNLSFNFEPTILSIPNIQKDTLSLLQVDMLLDETKVFSLSKEFIETNNLSSYYFSSDRPQNCTKGCILLQLNNSEQFLIPDTRAYYFTSFLTDEEVVWLSFILDENGFTRAQTMLGKKIGLKEFDFTDKKVTKITQKSPGSSKFDFNLDDGSKLSVDFKEKI